MIGFSVEGVPIPQGSKKAYVRGRCAVIVDDNDKLLKPWRQKIAAASDVGVTFDCPVAVFAVFYMPRPKRPKFTLPGVIPDLDKLMRALGDGMKDGGLLSDDSRIVDELIFKRYASTKNPPGVRVLVVERTDDDQLG